MDEKTFVLTHVYPRIATCSTEAARIFHGRGRTVRGFEFLTVDWYPPLVLVTVSQKAGRSKRIDRTIHHLEQAIQERVGCMIVQTRSKSRITSEVVFGEVPEPCVARENGLVFRLDPTAAGNIGFFPDMRSGRELVRRLAKDRSVLNLFAYSCSFSAAACAGGAARVVNLDMNRNLLERGRQNHRLNHQDLRQISFLPHNLFKSFGRLQRLGPFDLVVIDPPYRQGNSFRAERDWPKVLRRLPQFMAPHGDIVAVVSAPELGRAFLREQFTRHLPTAEFVTAQTAGKDFPEAEPDKGVHILNYRLTTA